MKLKVLAFLMGLAIALVASGLALEIK